MYKVTVKTGKHRHTDKRNYKPGEFFYVKFKSEIPEVMQGRFDFELVAAKRKNEIVVGKPQGTPITGHGVIEDLPGIDSVKLENLGRGWYNVIDAKTGNHLNPKKLRIEEAKELVAEHTGIPFEDEDADQPPEEEE